MFLRYSGTVSISGSWHLDSCVVLPPQIATPCCDGHCKTPAQSLRVASTFLELHWPT